VCLGYRRRAAAFAQLRDEEGGKVSVVRGRHRPPVLFYPSGDFPRHRREEVFLSHLHFGTTRKSLEAILVAPKANARAEFAMIPT
jgi:hypothetical protein